MDSSLTQSLVGVILPGELTDFPNPRTNSHIERGRLQGIGHPADKLPTRTLEIRDSRKNTTEAQNGRTPYIGTKVIAYHSRRRCGRKRVGGIGLASPYLSRPPRTQSNLPVRPGESSIAYAVTCAARGKQASGSPDMPITGRCVCPGIHKPADAKRLHRSTAPSVRLRMAPHTQSDGTSKATPLVPIATPDASAPRPDTTKNRTPKWACGRCTIELPGPSPAFDA